MLENEFRIVVSLAFVVAMVSLTVTRSRLFKGFRDWVDEVTAPNVNSDPSLWYELVKCPFCFSFWATAGTVPVFYHLWHDLADGWDQWGVTYFSVWGMACILCGAILKLFDQGGNLKND